MTTELSDLEKKLIEHIEKLLIERGFVATTARRRGQLDITRLSKELGMDWSHLYRIFKKEHRLTVEHLAKITGLLNITFLVQGDKYKTVEAGQEEIENAVKLLSSLRQSPPTENRANN